MMTEENLSALASTSSLSNAFSHMSIGAQSWLLAEDSGQAILAAIQPSRASEHRRKEVINYLQSVIIQTFGAEVFPLGSAPLKTYLPDGDIDLAIVCHPNIEEDLAVHMCVFFAREDHKDSQFVIRDVQYVHAQVASKFPVDLHVTFKWMSFLLHFTREKDGGKIESAEAIFCPYLEFSKSQIKVKRTLEQSLKKARKELFKMERSSTSTALEDAHMQLTSQEEH